MRTWRPAVCAIARKGAAALTLVVLGGSTPACSEFEPREGERGQDAGSTFSATRSTALPLRRLTHFEYRNTLTDLLGDEDFVRAATEGLLREPEAGGFRNGVATQGVLPVQAHAYLDIASKVAEAVVAKPGLVPCDVDAAADESECAGAFLQSFGMRAFRRPLSRAEREQMVELYALGAQATSTFRGALTWMTTGLLAAAPFLFRIELPVDEVETVRAFELATRLAYLLWQGAPDQVLLDAAAEGELETEGDISEQVRRMLGDAKSLRVYEFFEQWLGLDELPGLVRDDTYYPNLPAELPTLMQVEARQFVLNLLAGGGTLEELYTAPYTFANRRLAQHYALQEIPAGDAFERLAAPGRSGVLTQGMLIALDRADRTSIVRRGVRLRTDVLCTPPPPPPENANFTLPEPEPGVSQRERLEAHRKAPACRGCHAVIDPLGALFEGFDAVGRMRTEDELGQSVDVRATLTGLGELDGRYDSLSDFAETLATSALARRCAVEKAFHFFFGRPPDAADATSLDQLQTEFSRRGYRLDDLIVGLTRTDQFRYRFEEKAP